MTVSLDDNINTVLVATQISDVINQKLADNQKVLWLVSGGSAIAVAIAAMKKLQADLSNLYVGLIDERYGEVGHADSNWQQLKEVGFFDAKAQYVRVLNGKPLEATAQEYAQTLSKLLQSCDYNIGLLGIGPDGHTSGVLPNSIGVNSDNLVEYYQGPDHQRITTTLTFLKRLDEVFVYAVGEAKWPALKQALSKGSIDEIPARIYQQVNNVTLYTDYKGETS